MIPVLVGRADMPATDALPEPLKALAKRNGMTLRDAGFEQDFDQLVNAILGRPRNYLKTELDRVRRLLRAIRLSTLLVPAVTAAVVLALWVGLLDAFTLDTRAASYLLWAGDILTVTVTATNNIMGPSGFSSCASNGGTFTLSNNLAAT